MPSIVGRSNLTATLSCLSIKKDSVSVSIWVHTQFPPSNVCIYPVQQLWMKWILYSNIRWSETMWDPQWYDTSRTRDFLIQNSSMSQSWSHLDLEIKRKANGPLGKESLETSKKRVGLIFTRLWHVCSIIITSWGNLIKENTNTKFNFISMMMILMMGRTK